MSKDTTLLKDGTLDMSDGHQFVTEIGGLALEM